MYGSMVKNDRYLYTILYDPVMYKFARHGVYGGWFDSLLDHVPHKTQVPIPLVEKSHSLIRSSAAQVDTFQKENLGL